LATVKRPVSHNEEAQKVVVSRLANFYGSTVINTDIQALRRRKPELDRFDWLLLIMSLEIDLRVRVPQRLVEPKAQSVAQFAKAIAALPKVTSEQHTLDELQLLASVLLGDGDTSNSHGTARKRVR